MGLKCSKCVTTIKDTNESKALYLLEVIFCDVNPENKQITIGFVCRNCGNVFLNVIKTTKESD